MAIQIKKIQHRPVPKPFEELAQEEQDIKDFFHGYEPVVEEVSADEARAIAEAIRDTHAKLDDNEHIRATSQTFGRTTLFCQSDDGIAGHRKQWSIWFDNDPKCVWVQWGKEHGAKQQKCHRFPNAVEASDFLRKTVRDKIKKGYYE